MEVVGEFKCYIQCIFVVAIKIAIEQASQYFVKRIIRSPYFFHVFHPVEIFFGPGTQVAIPGTFLAAL